MSRTAYRALDIDLQMKETLGKRICRYVIIAVCAMIACKLVAEGIESASQSSYSIGEAGKSVEDCTNLDAFPFTSKKMEKIMLTACSVEEALSQRSVIIETVRGTLEALWLCDELNCLGFVGELMYAVSSLLKWSFFLITLGMFVFLYMFFSWAGTRQCQNFAGPQPHIVYMQHPGSVASPFLSDGKPTSTSLE